MAVSSSEYWEKRIAENVWKIYNTEEEKNRDLLGMYRKVTNQLLDDMYEYTAAIFKGDEPTPADAARFAKNSRLYKSMQKAIKQLGTDARDFGYESILDGMKKSYRAVRTGLGDVDFDLPNDNLLLDLLNQEWHGSNFSTRIWHNTYYLAHNVGEILISGLPQGKTIAEMAIALNNIMNDGFNNAHRLIRTETMYSLNNASLMAYKDGGVKKVEFCAALDERTCDVCGELHGKIYPIDKAIIIPVHPNCRCCWIPVVDIIAERR